MTHFDGGGSLQSWTAQSVEAHATVVAYAEAFDPSAKLSDRDRPERWSFNIGMAASGEARLLISNDGQRFVGYTGRDVDRQITVTLPPGRYRIEMMNREAQPMDLHLNVGAPEGYRCFLATNAEVGA